jgi:hypothetical protein
MLTALVGGAAGVYNDPAALVEVQPRVADVGIVDLVVTFEGGRRAVVEMQVEPGADESLLAPLVDAGSAWPDPAAFVMVTLPGIEPPAPWTAVSWLEVAEALDGDPDPLAAQFQEFVLRDILGNGAVDLDEAIATNRLYALGGAAMRRRFGERVRYQNSASRPLGGRYRYLGTTFALDGGEMEYWLGVVNESVPLSEHYHLMLASKAAPLEKPASQPRATGDWKWAHWTGIGRVVRPVTLGQYDELLGRLSAPTE